MINKFSERASAIEPSASSEILRYASRPAFINFGGGIPATEALPVDEFKAIFKDLFNEKGSATLQYNRTEGYMPLKEAICKRMNRTGLEASPHQVLITTGAMQAIDLTGKLFINEGDTILCEGPTFFSAIDIFDIYGARFVEVEMDSDGMIMEELERQLQNHPETKAIYTLPDFQNPSGRTMTLERRRKLIELANLYDVLVIEDDPYGPIRYDGEELPPLKYFDTEGRVIYISTFSKIIAPGIRLGWLYVDEIFMSKYIALKELADMHTDVISQMATTEFLENYDMEAHIQKVKSLYKGRLTVMLSHIEKCFPEEVTYTKPEGGLFVWLELPDYLDSNKILDECLKKDVYFLTSYQFSPSGTLRNGFRLNFSSMPKERIIEGIKRIGEVLNRNIKETNSVPLKK